MTKTYPGEMAIRTQPSDQLPSKIKTERYCKDPVDAKETEPAHAGTFSEGEPIRGTAFLGVKKLRGRNIILVAACHNRRTNQAEIGASGSIHPARSYLNETLAGPSSAKEVDLLAKKLMAGAEIKKLRKVRRWPIREILGVEKPWSTGGCARGVILSVALMAGPYLWQPVLSAFQSRPQKKILVSASSHALQCVVKLLPLAFNALVLFLLKFRKSYPSSPKGDSE